MKTIKASAELIRIIRAIPAHKRVAAARFAENKLNQWYAADMCGENNNSASAIANAILAVEAELAYQYGIK